MPVGHIEAFSEINPSYTRLCENYGTASMTISYAMQEAMRGESTDGQIFIPSQIIYGKCLTPNNTLKHLHLRFTDSSGDLTQAYPSDTAWREKEVVNHSGADHVLAAPVTSRPLDTERFERISSRLIEICNQ